jgi:hypothetical protein
VTAETFLTLELELLLRGKLPSGWSMNDVLLDEDVVDEIKAHEHQAKFRRTHAILFFVDLGSLSDAGHKKRLQVSKRVERSI